MSSKFDSNGQKSSVDNKKACVSQEYINILNMEIVGATWKTAFSDSTKPLIAW